MKIGIIFDGLSLPPKDGVTQRVYSLLNELENTNIDFRLYLGDRGWTKDSELKSETFDSTLFPASWLYDKNILKVIDIIKKDNVDILHITNSHPVVLIFGALIANTLNIPLVCDMHDIDHVLLSTLGRDKKEIKLAKDMQMYTAHCSDTIICMSGVDYKQLLKMGVDEKKLVCIPNGIIFPKYNRKTNHNKNIIFVGNLYYEPNLNATKSIIDSIAPLVWKECPDAIFNIIGRTPKRLKKNIDERIHIHGDLDDLSQIMDSSSVAIAPIYEGSGMKVKILTYSSYGLPIVATPTALMGYKEVQYILNSSNNTSLSKNICKLLKNPKIAEEYGRKNYFLMRKNYSWDKLIKKVIDTYKKANKIKHKKNRFDIDDLPKARLQPKILDIISVPTPFWLKEERFKNYVQANIKVRKIKSNVRKKK